MQVRVQPTQARPQRKHHITPHGWADRSARSWLRRHRIPRRNRPGTITARFPTAGARHGSLSAGGICGYWAGNHTHRAAHRPTDGTHPEPDAHTRDTCSPPKFLALVGPPTTTEQDPEPRFKARRASAHSASVTSSFRSQKYSTGEPTTTTPERPRLQPWGVRVSVRHCVGSRRSG